MAVFKHHLAPFKGNQITIHKGKGARPFPPQPKPGPLTQGAPSMNNYAKATPVPTPPPAPMGGPPSPMDSSPGQDQGMV